MSTESQKLRPLLLLKLFYQETDPKQGLTMPQIVERLAEQGVVAERKAVYRDLKVLEEFGVEVCKLKTQPVQYALAKRTFTEAELLLLADAVQSSRFLTKGKSEDLMRAIRTLGSKRQAQGLKKSVHVEGRVRTLNESVFSNVDSIQEAIAAKCKIRFKYFKYDCAKQQKVQHGGEPYTMTPLALIYSDGNYYLVAYNDNHDSFVNFRVDRMKGLVVLADEPAVRNAKTRSFDVTSYQSSLFGMWTGETVDAVLCVAESAVDSVIDRFGRDVEMVDQGDGTANVYVKVAQSPAFFGWMTQFGDRVTIKTPRSLASSYADYLAGIVEAYKS